MNIKSRLCDWARGEVSGYYFNPKTGEKRNPFSTRNIITYTAADVMARMLANQTLYIPQHMGFVYGTNAVPALPTLTSRVQPWSQLSSDLANVAAGLANVLISPFSSAPSVELNGSSSFYTNNAVTVTANSGARLEYGFSTTGAVYAPAIQDDGISDYMLQALLLARVMDGLTPTYYPFARVSLSDLPGVTYSVKPASWELAVSWKLTFS